MNDKGHIWYTSEEYPEGWGGADGIAYIESSDEDGYSSPHAGPMCKRCGYWYCEHCHPDGPPEKCDEETQESGNG